MAGWNTAFCWLGVEVKPLPVEAGFAGTPVATSAVEARLAADRVDHEQSE